MIGEPIPRRSQMFSTSSVIQCTADKNPQITPTERTESRNALVV